MLRDRVKELLPILIAFAENKRIQYRTREGWVDIPENDGMPISNTAEYRIKPDTKYRPFNSQKECFYEVDKHFPSGWVKETSTGILYFLNGISESGIVLPFKNMTFQEAMEAIEFRDGTKFGKEVEDVQ